MHHTFMHAHIPNPKFMVKAKTSTFGIFPGRNVLGRNVRAPVLEDYIRETKRFEKNK